MKKLSLSVVLILAAMSAFSQAEFAVGVKAGPNFAKINAEETAQTNYKNRTGFHGGAFALIKLTKIGIQPEVIFSQQGSKVTINTQDYESNFSYINIPIMLKLYTVAGINLQAGPQFGFLSSAKGPVVNLTTGQVTEGDVKKAVKSSDLTLALGLGWDLPFGLTIDGRYNLGLSKIYKDAPNTQQTSDAKNQVIQVSLGYKLFQFGK
jgi:opacity protein-like surface antigen